jgi:hypothetical protein
LVKNSSLLVSLGGWGALLLLAVLFPGLHLQAAAPAPPAIDLALPSAAPTLGGVSFLGGQGCDMDDQDPEESDDLNALALQPVAPQAEISFTGEAGGSDGPRWSLGTSDATQAHPSEGCDLRRRIFKKTR